MKIHLPLILIISLVMFTAPLTRISKAVEPVTTNEIYEANINIPNLMKLGTIKATNQGPYAITGYSHLSCQGSIALLPLYRNAEGSHILKRLVTQKESKYGVIFMGKIYNKFPQKDYTLNRIKRGLESLTRARARHQQPPKVLAFLEVGDCLIAEKVAFSI